MAGMLDACKKSCLMQIFQMHPGTVVMEREGHCRQSPPLLISYVRALVPLQMVRTYLTFLHQKQIDMLTNIYQNTRIKACLDHLTK